MVSLRNVPEPKSINLMHPVLMSMRMFSSLMSRWTTPCDWQYLVASRTCLLWKEQEVMTSYYITAQLRHPTVNTYITILLYIVRFLLKGYSQNNTQL